MLFNFADKIDVTLMIIGTISAMANGLAHPLMTLIFGKITNQMLLNKFLRYIIILHDCLLCI
jgi:hypothetical protein